MRYFILIGALIIFSSCGEDNAGNNNIAALPHKEISEKQKSTQEKESKLLQIITNSRKQFVQKKGSALLILDLIKENENEIIVDLILKNPERKEISAVRSFLAFSPDILSGTTIDFPKDSPFRVFAPGENIFDAKNGMVKIGVSVAKGKAFAGEKISLATLSFSRLSNSFSSIDFYGFGSAEKTVVLESIGKNEFQDILKNPRVPTLPLSPQS